MKPAILGTMALTACAVPNASAQAATLIVGGGWQTFYFGRAGSAISAPSGDTRYDFTLANTAELHVVDAFSVGDTFRIFNFGTVIGSTGVFNAAGPTTSSPAIAFAGDTYSKLSVTLAPGNYSISGIATASPFGAGGAYIELAPSMRNAVPEPSTWALMIGGYLLVGAAIRYRGRRLNTGYY